jgi:murein DD-endopeptidase MepM/ murein hydrolase activator NlpD
MSVSPSAAVLEPFAPPAPAPAAPEGVKRRRRFGRRSKLAKAGLVAGVAATAALTLNACSPASAIWYPLARPAVITQGFSAWHSGIDMYVPYGTPIHAATGGTVTQAGWWYGYGNYTCIQRDTGFKSCYAHQSVIYTHVGMRVTPGSTIGLVGATGDATGPHLHFEIYRFGQAVNPLPYLPPR